MSPQQQVVGCYELTQWGGRYGKQVIAWRVELYEGYDPRDTAGTQPYGLVRGSPDTSAWMMKGGWAVFGPRGDEILIGTGGWSAGWRFQLYALPTRSLATSPSASRVGQWQGTVDVWDDTNTGFIAFAAMARAPCAD